MTLSGKESVEAKIAERGFIRASEPACGSGAMVIALCAHEVQTVPQPEPSGRRPEATREDDPGPSQLTLF